ncbi:MAG: tRNA (cytidine(34)-2'-O)-methyltransferase [Planctomycetia bacterium]|nr:tRNA (cytidine(34)-2'-O)-methyltransferase [Planctomycetia bacterium]
MLHVALYEPEMPANTGNIGRLCVGVDCPLHLIGRTGFRLDDRLIRRAGLDYWPKLRLYQHATLSDFEHEVPGRVYCLSTKGTQRYTQARFAVGDVLLFGSESRGLPAEVLQRHRDKVLVIPMPGEVRSMNLGNAVSVVLYEALRQIHGW